MNFYKPLFWDLKKPNIYSYLLLPFTLILMINNFIVKKIKKKKYEKIFSICVGNIYLGGTGKTPTTIKLYDEIKKINKQVVVGKKNHLMHADEIKLLDSKTELIIDNDRSKIINKAIKKNKKIIIFDDGLQDRKIDYDLRFACFDTSNWIGNGMLMPSGPLRESLNEIKKFDAIFLKNIGKKSQNIIQEIKKIKSSMKIYNLNYAIKNLKKFDLKKEYIAFSGIGNPNSFKKILKLNCFKINENISFPDHYQYNFEDISKIIFKAKNKSLKIITTEKDYVKIPNKYKKIIDCLEVDLIIEKQNNLINFIKSSLNG
jgi:tetraacyldisaccharide 4'-kinase